MDNTSEPFTMRMVALEERQVHAERKRYLVIIKILNLLGGSVDTPGSVQFFKSKSYVVLTKMELIFKYREHQETDLILVLSYSEAQIATWVNLGMTKMTLPKTVRW